MKAVLLAGLLIASPALADDDLRDLCAERPGLDTPACTVDPGHLQVELGFGDWTLDKQAGSRTDTILLGQALARYGVGTSTEVRLSWTAYGHVRTRDRTSGGIDRSSGTGDITMGLKQNFSNPSGDGFSLALLPYATLPTGRKDIGAGDWGAGLLIPISFDLTEKVSWGATPEVDAAVDEDRKGRHLAFGAATGLDIDLSKRWSVSIEGQVIRDRDPSRHSTQALAGAFLGWKLKERLQFDAGAQAGLNRATPDVELYFGISEKF